MSQQRQQLLQEQQFPAHELHSSLQPQFHPVLPSHTAEHPPFHPTAFRANGVGQPPIDVNAEGGLATAETVQYHPGVTSEWHLSDGNAQQAPSTQHQHQHQQTQPFHMLLQMFDPEKIRSGFERDQPPTYQGHVTPQEKRFAQPGSMRNNYMSSSQQQHLPGIPASASVWMNSHFAQHSHNSSGSVGVPGHPANQFSGPQTQYDYFNHQIPFDQPMHNRIDNDPRQQQYQNMQFSTSVPQSLPPSHYPSIPQRQPYSIELNTSRSPRVDQYQRHQLPPPENWEHVSGLPYIPPPTMMDTSIPSAESGYRTLMTPGSTSVDMGSFVPRADMMTSQHPMPEMLPTSTFPNQGIQLPEMGPVDFNFSKSVRTTLPSPEEEFADTEILSPTSLQPVMLTPQLRAPPKSQRRGRVPNASRDAISSVRSGLDHPESITSPGIPLPPVVQLALRTSTIPMSQQAINDLCEKPPFYRPLSASKHLVVNGKRKMLEDSLHCRRCGQLSATLIMHAEGGVWNVVPNGGLLINCLCAQCLAGEGGATELIQDSDEAVSGQASASATSTGKRKRIATDESLECEVCKQRFCSGLIRYVDGGLAEECGLTVEKVYDGAAGPNDKPGLSALIPSQSRRKQQGGAQRSDFKIEIVCTPCRSKYRFCTECGGGGKYRTGKYRPTELFIGSRRTCLLSHVRLGGASSVSIVVYEASGVPVSAQVLDETRDVHNDGFYSLFACTEIMEARATRLATFERVQSLGMHGWKAVEGLLRGEKAAALPAVVRLLGCAYMERPSGKGRGGSCSTVASLGQLRASGGTLVTLPLKKGNAALQCAAEDEARAAGALANGTLRSIQVAYAAAEWDRTTGTLFVGEAYVRVTTPTTLGILRQLYEALLSQTQTISAREGTVGGVQWIWTVIRVEHVRLQSYVERLGFVAVDEWAKRGGRNSEVAEWLKMRAQSWAPMERVKCFVADTEDFLRAGREDGTVNAAYDN
ncbi:hypothetical protein BJ742DRAFT_786878 [Cladochytrium replicatum]|nr:hypothetical protein BJ742DRAFT_786878 [Cladochytrium replicatum]